MHNDPEVLKHEDRIVWTEDIEELDYVRETLVTDAGTRRRAVPWHGPGRRVGYSVLKADAPSGDGPGMFIRRIFWVKEYDRSEHENGPYKTGAPSEGVDPRTVKPGVWGEQNDRAWGGSVPTEAAGSNEQRDTPMVGRQKARSQAKAPRHQLRENSSALEAGAKEAFADWLYLHEVSVPDALGAAIGEAFSDWLRSHSEELKDAIAEAVARRIAPPDLHPTQDES